MKLRAYKGRKEINWSSWDGLDTMLTSPHLSCLTKVAVELELQSLMGFSYSRLSMEDEMQELGTVFPALREKGILDIWAPPVDW